VLLLLLQTTININGNEVGMYHYAHKGVDWVFVDHPCYPRPGGIYADEHGVYGDNQVRLQQQQLQQCGV
jgi:starch synthase